MKSYSQNKEDLFVADYFGGYRGALLDIGANDGVTFSNSRLLLLNGWTGSLIEPGDEYINLETLYADNFDISLFNYGLGDKTEMLPFWQSGAHVKNGSDSGLVSTFDKAELARWPDVKFIEKSIKIVEFKLWYNFFHSPKFDFISIDAEGMDWQILKQIDLVSVGCRCLCIEWNGDKELAMLYTNYCSTFGMAEALRNAENLIFTIHGRLAL